MRVYIPTNLIIPRAKNTMLVESYFTIRLNILVFIYIFYFIKIYEQLPLNVINVYKVKSKELSLCHKFSFCKTYIFATLWYEPLIFQTYIIWSNSIHSLKYLRYTTLGCKCNDIKIRKSEFVAKTQFLSTELEL